MSSIVRTIVLAVVASVAFASPTARASEIDYSFDVSVRSLDWQDLGDNGINPGDRGTMTFRVNAATPSDQNGTGWARYSGAIVGGGVTIGSLAWSYNRAGDNDYVAIWNDQPLGSLRFEGIEFNAPMQGPWLNDLAPAWFSLLLLHVGPTASDAITSLAFPTALDLANFDTASGGLLEFGFYGGPSIILDLLDVRITSEPPTLLLQALGLVAAVLARAPRGRPAGHGRFA